MSNERVYIKKSLLNIKHKKNYFEYLYDVIYEAESALCNINTHHLQLKPVFNLPKPQFCWNFLFQAFCVKERFVRLLSVLK
jgi:hypothetical protein